MNAQSWSLLLRCQRFREERQHRAYQAAAGQVRLALDAHQLAQEREKEAQRRYSDEWKAAHDALSGGVVEASALWDLRSTELTLARAVTLALEEIKQAAAAVEIARATEREMADALRLAMRRTARREKMWARHQEQLNRHLDRQEEAHNEDWLDAMRGLR